MKLAKRILTAGVALALTLGLNIPAFAASGTNDNNGSITINNAVPGYTYNAYQILVLESYDDVSGAYSYTVDENWEEWLETQTQYVQVDNQGYVTWVANTDDATVAAFAKSALEYAEGDENIKPDGTQVAAGEGETATVTFSNLNLGYYLVDTSMGALCSLGTTDKDATVQEKNAVPTVDKDDINADESDSPSIGDTVDFVITITAQKGAENYKLHDAMGDGLDLVPNSVKVYTDSAYTMELATGYTVAYADTTPFADGCDFEVTFTEDYLNTISTETKLYVKYSAVLNENAVTGVDAVTNEAILDYGDNHHTEEETGKTTTNVYSFDLVKTDSNEKLLNGAEFQLYDGDELIKFVKLLDGSYRVAAADDTNTVNTIVVTNGKVTIDGLGNGVYTLKETKAPAGYNKLESDVTVTINNTDNSATVSDGTYVSGGVQVENKAGSLLPSTGGMGTTILYIAGAALVLGAGVTLVVRRRMNSDR